ncbi:uncharacterized protein si:ch211-218d20.15 isoform X2 [Channa argus]|uniref:uncharacterized protein si:ch211-218d20.15 isoform X2 n=1 Tax=Channa argus TaxID=215402 RepID=UPI003521902F
MSYRPADLTACLVSGTTDEETSDACPAESRAGGSRDAVSLWATGPPHQSTDAAVSVLQFQEQLGQGCSPEESDTFQAQGSEILDQMLQCLEHLPKPMPQLEDYLDMVGLSVMFPRVEVFLIQGSPVDMLERPPMDEYFFHIAKLNQLLVLSQQLEEDIRHLGSHKYIAHQLSVIYQVLSSFRGIQVFSEIKKDIEANFKQIKQSLVTEESSRHEPQLAAHYITWILEITQSLTSTVLSLPEGLTDELHQAVSFVAQFLS